MLPLPTDRYFIELIQCSQFALSSGSNTHMAAHELSRRYRKDKNVNGVQQLLAQVRLTLTVHSDLFMKVTANGCVHWLDA